MSHTPDTNGERLERIERKLDTIGETVSGLRERTAALEVKSGIWGALSGILASLGLSWFRGH